MTTTADVVRVCRFGRLEPIAELGTSVDGALAFTDVRLERKAAVTAIPRPDVRRWRVRGQR